MVASMTGFARQSYEAQWGSLVWELRSVNHRFLDISLRLPDGLREIEMAVRECIQNHLKRGKVEASLKFTPGQEVPFDMVVNEPLLQQLSQSAATVAKYFPQSNASQTDLLKWPGLLSVEQTNMEVVAKSSLSVLKQGLEELVAVRQREGDGLATFIDERLNTMVGCIETVESHLPAISQQMRDKILARFEELSLEVDSDRLEQEMVWLLQKIDVAEELQRLKAHIKEVQRVLVKETVAGRRLDFLMQELNREANTLGSKSIDGEVTQAVVELKVQIEQIREQVQNIE